MINWRTDKAEKEWTSNQPLEAIAGPPGPTKGAYLRTIGGYLTFSTFAKSSQVFFQYRTLEINNGVLYAWRALHYSQVMKNQNSLSAHMHYYFANIWYAKVWNEQPEGKTEIHQTNIIGVCKMDKLGLLSPFLFTEYASSISSRWIKKTIFVNVSSWKQGFPICSKFFPFRFSSSTLSRMTRCLWVRPWLLLSCHIYPHGNAGGYCSILVESAWWSNRGKKPWSGTLPVWRSLWTTNRFPVGKRPSGRAPHDGSVPLGLACLRSNESTSRGTN